MKTLILITVVLMGTQAFANSKPVQATKKKQVVSAQVKPKKDKEIKEEEEETGIKAKTQWSLGLGSLNLESEGAKSSFSYMNVGFSYKASPVGKSDVEVAINANAGYNSVDQKSLMLATVQLEWGYRYFLSKDFSIAPHIIFGGAYMNYKNETTNLHQFYVSVWS
jgi:hypothetical protein